MRLLYLASQRFPTEKAYGVQIAKMCEAFANAGIEVELVVPTRKGAIADSFEYYGVKRNFRFTRIASPDFYLPWVLDRIAFYVKQFIAAKRLARYAKENGADIFYTRDELVAIFLNWYSLRTVVFEAHNFSDRRRAFYGYFKNRGNKIVVISKKLGDEFRTLGFGLNEILIARDGFDQAEFADVPGKEEARRLLGLSEDTKIIMYTGHLFVWKGADILAQAASFLPDMFFVFVGGTSGDIERLRRLYGSAKNILIVGHRPHTDIPTYLSAADVLVLPNLSVERMSVQYTSPLKLFEYMAAMRPIVASDLPSIREVLNEGNAVFFEAGNAPKLAEVIERVTSDTGFSKAIAGQAAQDAQDYTWGRRVSRIIQFLQ